MTILLEDLPKDYDVYLYSEDETLLARPYKGGTTSEEILYEVPESSAGYETLYIRVEGYLEMMTGTYYCLDADNQVEAVENILDEQFGEGAYWSFALDNISEVMENDHKVVLVECVNIVMEGDKAEQDPIYRWFEVPDNWTKDDVIEKLSKI